MNTEQLIARVRGILLTPKTEWPVIAAEPDTTAGLFTRYILILSAIPPVAGFLKHSLIGISAPFIGTVRVGIGAGLTAAVMQYVFGLIAVYIVALIVNALAPTFGGQKDWMQALKATAYAFTASWIASAFVIVPALGWLLALAGGVYAIYLLYLGLPATMHGPSDKAAGYTAVTVISTIVLSIVLGVVVNRISGISGMMAGMDGSRSTTVQINSGNGSATIDSNAALGALGAMAKSMQASSQKLQEAQKSGDQAAQNKAAGEMVGGLFGGGEAVEALSPEQLKPFVPDTLDGLPRSNYSMERNTALGLQVAQAQATYRDAAGAHSVDLQIVDMGGAKGLAAFAGWAVQKSERETDTGYERVYQDGSRMIHEEWNSQSHSGTYDLVLAQRFTVKLHSTGLSMDDLKALAGSLNLSGLEALKSSGVKPG